MPIQNTEFIAPLNGPQPLKYNQKNLTACCSECDKINCTGFIYDGNADNISSTCWIFAQIQKKQHKDGLTAYTCTEEATKGM